MDSDYNVEICRKIGYLIAISIWNPIHILNMSSLESKQKYYANSRFFQSVKSLYFYGIKQWESYFYTNHYIQ